jgi:nucleoside-diphosphate-sugar epimerase
MWAEHFATYPALGERVVLPFPPETRDTWIYKEDCAEQLIRLAIKPKLAHFAYNNGGTCVSARELAAQVRSILPDARIEFDSSKPGTPLIDNQDGTRLAREIDFVPRPLVEGIRAHINEARQSARLPTV